jgi:hypothetical protein
MGFFVGDADLGGATRSGEVVEVYEFRGLTAKLSVVSLTAACIVCLRGPPTSALTGSGKEIPDADTAGLRSGSP